MPIPSINLPVASHFWTGVMERAVLQSARGLALAYFEFTLHMTWQELENYKFPFLSRELSLLYSTLHHQFPLLPQP